MLAAAALGALGAQLAEIRAAKEDWFVGAGRVDKEDVSLEADGAVTVRRQPPFDKALRNFPKMESPPKGKAERRLEVTDYETVMSGEPFPLPAPSAGHRFRRHDLACARRLTAPRAAVESQLGRHQGIADGSHVTALCASLDGVQPRPRPFIPRPSPATQAAPFQSAVFRPQNILMSHHVA